MHTPHKDGPETFAGGGLKPKGSLTCPLTVVRSAVRLMLAAVALLVLSAPARAGVSFQLGNHPQSDEENILLNSGETGNPVFGTTQKTGVTVRFSSTTDTLTEPSSGAARVASTDGKLNNITIDVPERSFTDLIINPFKGEGKANVTVVLDDGTSSFSYTLGDGNNFLTIVALDGEKILSVTVDAKFGFQDLRQPRISGVPEPSTMALALVGVAGLGLGGLRRLHRRPPAATA